MVAKIGASLFCFSYPFAYHVSTGVNTIPAMHAARIRATDSPFCPPFALALDRSANLSILRLKIIFWIVSWNIFWIVSWVSSRLYQHHALVNWLLHAELDVHDIYLS